MPLPDYLENNSFRINELPHQELGPWGAQYNAKEFHNFPVVQELNERFPQRTIQREDIVNLFLENRPYLAFVAAMVWGYINATRPREQGGGPQDTNFYCMLAHGEQNVLKAIESAQQHLQKGDFTTPFKDMMPNGVHRIPGVGYAYFTKLFFFLGQSDDEVKIKPLIFDKWTSNAFCALLSQSDPKCVKNYFNGLKQSAGNINPGRAIVGLGQNLVKAYESYVLYMNEWATELGVPPGRLEEFVFGSHLGHNNADTNPRRELWDIAINNARICGLGIRYNN